MSVTCKEIAELVGVSRQAAASVLNNSTVCHVAKDKKERILKLARELNYRPNDIAKILKGKPSYIIGILLDSYANSPTLKILGKVETLLAKNGYRALIGQTHECKEVFCSHLDSFKHYNTAGIIAFAHTYLDPDFNLYKELSECSNVVLQGHQLNPDILLPTVEIDWVHGYYEITKQLITNGARRIAIQLYWPASSNWKLEGYKQALKECDVPFREELVINTRSCKSLSISDYMNKLLQLKADAYLTSDKIGVPLISEFQKHGIAVPDEISIVGCYNEHYGTYIYPSLTTIDCNVDEIAEKLCDILFKMINGQKTSEMELVTPELVIRESTRLK